MECVVVFFPFLSTAIRGFSSFRFLLGWLRRWRWRIHYIFRIHKVKSLHFIFSNIVFGCKGLNNSSGTTALQPDASCNLYKLLWLPVFYASSFEIERNLSINETPQDCLFIFVSLPKCNKRIHKFEVTPHIDCPLIDTERTFCPKL